MPAGIQFVNSGQGTDGGLTYNPNAAGNLLLAVVYCNATTPVAGSGWISIDNSSINPRLRILYRYATANDAASGIPNPTTSSPCTIGIIEFFSPSGWPAGSPVDVEVIDHNSSATPPTFGLNISPTFFNDAAVLVAFCSQNGDTPPSSIAGMIIAQTLSQAGGAVGNGILAYALPQLFTVGGVYSKTGTWTGGVAAASTAALIAITPAPYSEAEPGSVTGAGSRNENVAAVQTGAISPAGGVARAIVRALSQATITVVGTIAKAAHVVLTGAITAVTGGSAKRKYARQEAATVTGAGSNARAITEIESGALTPAGAVARAINRALAIAHLTATSALTETLTILEALTGSITGAGTERKLSALVASGSISPGGAVVRQVGIVVSASVTAAGRNARAIGAQILAVVTPSGAAGRAIVRTFAQGRIQAASALNHNAAIVENLIGAITGSGAFAKQADLAATGSVTQTSSMHRAIVAQQAAQIGVAGGIIRRLPADFFATVLPAGSLGRGRFIHFVASIASAGQLLGGDHFFASFTGSIAPQGGIGRMISRLIAAVITLVGSIKTHVPATIILALPIVDTVSLNLPTAPAVVLIATE